jgi:DNA-binding transcriptional MerR regulator
MINELGVTQLMKKVSNTLEKVNHLHDDFPFLDKDYLLFPGGGRNLSLLSELLDSLESLEYTDLLKYVANYQQKEPAELTLADIKEACQAIEASANYYALKDEVTEIAKLLEIEDDDLQKLYTRLSSAQKTLETISGNFLMDVFQIGKFYTDALSELGVSIDDVSSFHKLAGESEQMDTFWNFVLLHEDVCKYKLSSPPEQKKVEKFHQKEKKQLEYKNDERMKNLNNHAGDIQRAITAVESGKRLTDEQSQVLFDNLSCIIAPPELISEYFPMSKDMVDMLIID